MHGAVYASFGNEEVMVYHGDMVFRELDICRVLAVLGDETKTYQTRR